MAKYSIIVPVFNRPDEVDELLDSLTRQTVKDFEVVIVEDGSKVPCSTNPTAVLVQPGTTGWNGPQANM